VGADARDVPALVGSDAKERDAGNTTSDLPLGGRDAALGGNRDAGTDDANVSALAQDGPKLAGQDANQPDTAGTSSCRCTMGRGHSGKDGGGLWLLLAALWLGRRRSGNRRS
jgi:MYXO-CTERM domain-containing protein